MKQLLPTEKPIERAIVISVVKKGGDRIQAMDYLDELAFLAETAGAEVIGKVYQERVRPDRSTMIGKGKVAEVKEMIEQDDIQSVIFDDDLSPMQVRNLEKEWNVKVLDRSGVILDIFASRASLYSRMNNSCLLNTHCLIRNLLCWDSDIMIFIFLF